jgi:tripartite-type tricarboxylate transporter receptor subunit TctC
MRLKQWSRSLLAAAVLFSAASAVPSRAHAQDAVKDWPNKPVRIIVNFGPGGSTDSAIRPFADRLSRALGQQFVIENRGGASGALGLEATMKSPPDGYTFVATPALSLVIMPTMRKTPYDPIKDFAPVSIFSTGTLLMAIHPTVPANSVAELVDYAKKNPGKLAWGTAGVGSHGHIISEAFKFYAGVDILHIPYRGGGESLSDFLANVVQVHADPNTMPHIPGGKAKLLAVIDRERHPDYPNVPMLKEVYPQIDFFGWFGLLAPAGTPKEIVDRMAGEMNKIARDKELAATFLKQALAPSPGTPEEMAALIKSDYERYGKLTSALKMKLE